MRLNAVQSTPPVPLGILLLLNVVVLVAVSSRVPDLRSVVASGLLIGCIDLCWVSYFGSDSIVLDTILVGAVMLTHGVEWAALTRFISFLLVSPLTLSRAIDPLLYASGVPLTLLAGLIYRLLGGHFGSLSSFADLASAIATAALLGVLTPLPHLAVGGNPTPSPLATGFQTFVLRVIRQNPLRYLVIGFFAIVTAVTTLHVSPVAGLLTGVSLAVLMQYHVSKAQLLNRTYRKALSLLMSIVEARDPYTRGHSERVAAYCVALGRQMGIPSWRWEALHEAGLLHDLGKLVIPIEIVRKSGPLTDEEYRQVQRHSEAGAELVAGFGPNDDLATAVRHHHERYAGGGYPDGLVSRQIPLWSRIIAVADAFDAMTSTRPYRSALSVEQALSEIRVGTGRQFDPEVAAAAFILKTGAQAARTLACEVTGETPESFARGDEAESTDLDGLEALQMGLERMMASGRPWSDPEVRELVDRIDWLVTEYMETVTPAPAQVASTSEDELSG